jgi:hypothetical protein
VATRRAALDCIDDGRHGFSAKLLDIIHTRSVARGPRLRIGENVDPSHSPLSFLLDRAPQQSVREHWTPIRSNAER